MYTKFNPNMHRKVKKRPCLLDAYKLNNIHCKMDLRQKKGLKHSQRNIVSLICEKAFTYLTFFEYIVLTEIFKFKIAKFPHPTSSNNYSTIDAIK